MSVAAGSSMLLQGGFPHQTGHGLGLPAHEPPYVAPGSRDELRAGDVVAVELGLYFARLGGARPEEADFVTEGGARPLTSFPRVLTESGGMSMNGQQICRFEQDGADSVGLLSPAGTVVPIKAESMAELLSLPLSEIRRIVDASAASGEEILPDRLLAPADRQEVWAAGVTYERSREARVAESGMVDVYTRAYDAERPELFFKATAERVVLPGGAGRLRADSTWDACEPELAVVANAFGDVVGYAIGNDLCSRSIEAENPLYLPQAKSYTDCCLLAPGWTPAWEMPEPRTGTITMTLLRDGTTLYEDTTPLSRLRRTPEELVSWLFRELAFPHGVFLLTGTGLVAPDDVRLDDGDEVIIRADGLGKMRHALYRGPVRP